MLNAELVFEQRTVTNIGTIQYEFHQQNNVMTGARTCSEKEVVGLYKSVVLYTIVPYTIVVLYTLVLYTIVRYTVVLNTITFTSLTFSLKTETWK